MKGKKIYIVVIAAVFFVLFLGILFTTSHKVPLSTFVVTPTPITVPLPNQYHSVDSSYSLSYPIAWNAPSVPSSELVKPFTFSVNGKTYRFLVSPGGQIHPDGYPYKTDVHTVVYHGLEYRRTIWFDPSTNLPFYMVTEPSGTNTTSYVFAMDIPPVNSNYYIAEFDHVVSQAKVNK